ncbi:MAG TPA: MFS transporter [Flavobacteriales bacterium]|nr:MFS transporter [Flavobacteriales bacterium]
MAQSPNLNRVIFASSAGTVIEWYDFYIFGSLATIISTQFFPKENPAAAFLATLAAFGVGFVIRPFGAIVFGRLGDLVGRKHTFLLTLLIMGGSTCAIGLIPGYGTIGVLAPVLVFLLRALQGLALGGEYGGAATYVAEHSPQGKRGFYTSFIQTTATLGLFISIGVILLCRILLGEEKFNDWGWRVPFLLSSVLVIFSYIIRKRMDESPEFVQLKKEQKTSKNPLKESFGQWSNLKWVLIALFGATAGQGVVWYTGQFYAMNFCKNALHVDAAQVEKMLLVVLLLGTPLFIVFAKLSDKWGRKWIMLTGIGLAALSYYPVYIGMAAQADYKTMLGQEQPAMTYEKNASGEIISRTFSFSNGTVATEIMNADKPVTKITLGTSNLFVLGLLVFVQLVFVTMAYGPIAAFLVELFPAKIRYTSMSLPYHIGNGVFGGLTPLIAESLVLKTGNMFAGLYYPITVAALTVIVGAVFIRNRTE